MKLIIIGSGKMLINLINECKLYLNDIDIISVCNLAYNKTTTESTQIELDMMGIKTVDVNNKSINDVDLVVTINCAVILPSNIVNRTNIINVHIGILPKYRGNSANTWGIMNGEKYVGFTIHKMVDMLDAGDIYYVNKIPLERNQTYSDVYDKLMNSIVKDTPKVILDIYNGNITAKKQKGDYLYCTMFSKEMGQIRNFDVDSEYIFNLYRCMARPHGSGIYFYKNGITYETRKVIPGHDKGVCDYIGIPGKIVNVFDDMIWIKTRDNVILFGDIVDEVGNKVNVKETFKNGNKLDLE